ncbi:hypothetical protein Tco_0905002 [Tanacetum coccineum]
MTDKIYDGEGFECYEGLKGGESSAGIGSQGQFKGGVGNSNERAEAAPTVVAPVKSGKKINIEEEVEER